MVSQLCLMTPLKTTRSWEAVLPNITALSLSSSCSKPSSSSCVFSIVLNAVKIFTFMTLAHLICVTILHIRGKAHKNKYLAQHHAAGVCASKGSHSSRWIPNHPLRLSGTTLCTRCYFLGGSERLPLGWVNECAQTYLPGGIRPAFSSRPCGRMQAATSFFSLPSWTVSDSFYRSGINPRLISE